MDLRKIIKELLGLSAMPKGEGLVGFSAEQLSEAQGKLREIASYNKDLRNVDDLRAAVDAFEAVSTEMVTRTEAQAKTDEEIAALDQRLAAQTDPEEQPPGDGDGNDDGNDGNEGDGNDGEGNEPAQPQVETVAASAPVPEPTIALASGADDPPITLTAAGDVKGHSAGQVMDPTKVAEAMLAKANAIVASRAEGQFPVGQLEWTYPTDRRLSYEDTASVNSKKVNAIIAAAQAQTREYLDQIMWESDPKKLDALVAAGGLCAPVNVRYELFTVGTTARPLRDSLTRFGATRGGIRFNAPPTLANLRAEQAGVTAVNIYSAEDDANSTGYPKGCIRVVCTEDIEEETNAITLCMEVGNFSRMFNPESFNAWWGLGRVQHARIAEDRIWSRLDALSTNVSAGEGLGAAPDVLTSVERAATQYRDRHRIDPETPLRLRAPAFLRNIMRVDLARRAPGDSTMAVTNAEIARHFASRDIAVTWVLDGQTASRGNTYDQGAFPVNGWPSTVDVNIAIDGTFLFLDSGTLDFGTEIRDWDQIRNNDVGAFMETFEEVAFVGPEALHMTLNLCPDGTTSGPSDTFDPCTTGS